MELRGSRNLGGQLFLLAKEVECFGNVGEDMAHRSG